MKAPILFDTRFGSTERAANALARGLPKRRDETEFFRVKAARFGVSLGVRSAGGCFWRAGLRMYELRI